MLSSGLRIPLLPPLLLFLSAMELSWSFTDDQKKLIVDLHNEYRSQVSPPAADMLKMVSELWGASGFAAMGEFKGVSAPVCCEYLS